MPIGTELLTDLIADTDLSETLSVTPDSGSASTPSALVNREEVRIENHSTRGRFKIFEAVLRVLASDHTPAVGDNWTIAKARGGTGVANWYHVTATGRDGYNEIRVRLTEDLELGGHDPDE